MEKTSNASDEEAQEIVGLLDNVFSWTLQDVLNEDLYKYKVPYFILFQNITRKVCCRYKV